MRSSRFISMLAGLLLAMGPLAAFGGAPVFTDKFSESGGPFLDEFLQANCGADIYITYNFKVKYSEYADGSVRQHINYTWAMTNPSNGAEVIETAAFNIWAAPVAEFFDFDAGTLTLVFNEIVRGTPFKWRQKGVGVFLHDAGDLTIKTTLVIDLATGETVDFSQDVTSHGPHPQFFISDTEQTAIICNALTG